MGKSATPLHEGPAAAPGGHPCLTGNNSINAVSIEAAGGIGQEERNEKVARAKDYTNRIVPCMSGYHFKASQRMQKVIELAAAEHGRESLGVIHLTFADDVHGNAPSYEVAQARLNSLATNVFAKRYRSAGLNNWLVVCEKGEKYGRIHFHCLVVKKGADFATGSRKGWNKKLRRRTFHANEDCRKEWEFYQSKLAAYGFGARIVVEPLWSIKGGAVYFSKYVGKGHYTRSADMRGKQLIRYATGLKKYHSGVFSPAGGASRDRRKVLAWIGSVYGCEDLGELNELFGSRWQYYSGDQIKVLSALQPSTTMGKRGREWVVDWVWARWKVKLFEDWLPSGAHYFACGHKYQLTSEGARQYYARAAEAPDTVFEGAAWIPRPELQARAERDLLIRLESLVMEPSSVTVPHSPACWDAVDLHEENNTNTEDCNDGNGIPCGANSGSQLGLAGGDQEEWGGSLY